MRRTLAVALLLGWLALLTLPTAGLLPLAPALSPGTFLRLALLSTGFTALLVVPWGRRREGAAAAVLLVVGVALPFLAFGILETPAPGLSPRPAPGRSLVVPDVAWAIVVVAALAAALLPFRLARGVTVCFLVLFAGAAFLAKAGTPLLPAAWNPAGLPLASMADAPFEERPVSDRLGWRTGAPLSMTADEARTRTEGPGPLFEPAFRGRFPESEALVLLVGGGARDEVRRVPELGTFVPAREADLTHALLLDAFDAAVVLPRAGSAEEADPPDAGRLADRLVVFARRGGVLVGPAPERPWPSWLGRRLGPAARVPASGPHGVEGNPLGLGRVLRAASDDAMREVLEREVGGGLRARTRRAGTVFDPPGTRLPPWPRALERWHDEPPARRPQVILLLVYAFVAATLDRILDRQWAARTAALALVVGAAVVGVASASPRDPGVRAHGVVLDLAGGGGRHIEAVALATGPAAWEGHVRWREASGITSVLGGAVGTDGRVRVPGRSTAWIVMDSVGRGDREPLGAAPRAAFLRLLLDGDVTGYRIETGLGGALPVWVEGVETGPAWVLRLR